MSLRLRQEIQEVLRPQLTGARRTTLTAVLPYDIHALALPQSEQPDSSLTIWTGHIVDRFPGLFRSGPFAPARRRNCHCESFFAVPAKAAPTSP